MARLNPAVQAQSKQTIAEEEVIRLLTPMFPGIVKAPFAAEQTRPFFEAQYRKDMAHLNMSEDDFKAELARNPLNNDEYYSLDLNIEWQGWKRGVMLGYELWGKK